MKAYFILLFYFTIPLHSLANTMIMNQVIKDGQTIVSPQQNFELGFFSPGNASENRYVGIWFKRLATGTILWVANRDTPIKNKSGELTLNPEGVLVIRDSTNNVVIWSSSIKGNGNNPVATLMDNGDLIITDDDDNGSDNYIWRSFDYVGDTTVPGMKFGRNFKGIVTNLTSWKSFDDPSKGSFVIYMDFNGLPQIFEKNIGSNVIKSRLGSWNGIAFTGRPKVSSNSVYAVKFVSNEQEIYTTSELININSSVLTRLTISPAGYNARYSWFNQTVGWLLFSAPTTDACDQYGLCGPYGSCDIQQSPPCECIKGFTPTRVDQWDSGDWKSGCRREIALDCGNVGEGFRRYPFVKIPDTRQSWVDPNMTVKECKIKCKSECNCTAYATLNVVLGTGCVLWYGDLMDIRTFPDAGQDVYIRMATAELDKDKKGSKGNKNVRIIVIPVILGLLVSLLGLFLLIIKKIRGRHGTLVMATDVFDLPLLSFSQLLTATNNFSEENKVGEGGFGPVYKGFLKDGGQEVAVKRLSRSSNQGVEEFKNEVLFISKLQHRNLVKMLGFCIEGDERLLVYEYMSNKGLDLYIYKDKSNKLDWPKLFNIINGIARGLVYLHQDSQLRIIHRDLKAGNILLDHEMNPKISDFGTARTFIEDDTKTRTKRLVGTYGYMSPEYAGNGIISVKSDVFSFGVILLEALSGMKNRGFSHEDHSQNLLGHVWKLYKQGNALDLVDVSWLKSNQISEVLRSIQVGLLCVQDNAADRPNMSEVIMMLSGKGQLAEPKQPGFFTEQSCETSTAAVVEERTNNNLTFTILEAR